MKKLISTIILLATIVFGPAIMAQTMQKEYLGLPGDNLNLYAVMKLFQESETLEGFEKKLNDENSRINNLDLNGDNYVDYIRVIDYADDNFHNIVMRVDINKNETQDVAVFTVQRFANDQVQIQLIGDEALYGKNYIIEPAFDDQLAGQTPNPGYTGNSGSNVAVVRTTTYEIATWPVIRYIYLPSYVVWRSAFHWNYYPTYWRPWKPYYWHYYYGYHYHWYNSYYSHYRRWHTPRYAYWNDYYYNGYRSHSRYVSNRIKSGHYSATYSQPNQRRHGEALYARTVSNQSSRQVYQSSGNKTARRSATQVNQNRQSTSTRTIASRKTSTNVSNRSAVKPASKQYTSSARRPISNNTNKSVVSSGRKVSGTSASPTRRTSTNVARSASKPTSKQYAGTAKKSVTVSKRPASNQKSIQSRSNSTQKASRTSSYSHGSSGNSKYAAINKSRSNSKPAITRSGSSQSRSSVSKGSSARSKPASSSKSYEKKKVAESSKSSRRK